MKSKYLNNIITTLLTSTLLLATPIIAFSADKQDDKTSKQHGDHDHAHDHGDSDHAHDHSDEHNEPHHGGIVGTADGFHHELVLTEEGKIVFYAEGLPTDEKLKTIIVRLIILQGKEKQSLEMVLTKDDKHRFEVPITTPLKENDKVVALINMGDKNIRMVRFEVTKN